MDASIPSTGSASLFILFIPEAPRAPENSLGKRLRSIDEVVLHDRFSFFVFVFVSGPFSASRLWSTTSLAWVVVVHVGGDEETKRPGQGRTGAATG